MCRQKGIQCKLPIQKKPREHFQPASYKDHLKLKIKYVQRPEREAIPEIQPQYRINSIQKPIAPPEHEQRHERVPKAATQHQKIVRQHNPTDTIVKPVTKAEVPKPIH